MKESTATIETADGLDLYLRRWETEGVAHQWTFVLVHGLGEHGGRYQHFAEWFTLRGATVYAMDQRGHGRSGSPEDLAKFSLRAFTPGVSHHQHLEMLLDCRDGLRAL